MKFIFECLLSVFLHPVAVVLAWMNVLSRSDLRFVKRVLWCLVILIPFGPIVYLVLSDGSLW